MLQGWNVPDTSSLPLLTFLSPLLTPATALEIGPVQVTTSITQVTS